MSYKNFLAVITLYLSISFYIFPNNTFVIGSHTQGDGIPGFFSLFLQVLNCLKWCEKNRRIPIIYWDAKCTYYEPLGYNGHTNAWEYYFEPVSAFSPQPTDTIYRCYRAPDNTSVSLKPTGKQRKEINKLIKKYITIKPIVQAKINTFYKQTIKQKYTIGIHIRGTDKWTEGTPIPSSEIFAKANEIAKKHPGCQFFIATDEQRILEEAQKILNGRVIYYPAHRSTDGKPLHREYNQNHEQWLKEVEQRFLQGNNNYYNHQQLISKNLVSQSYNKAQLGEEVLIEALLLAQCNFFIHTFSNVSIAVLYFNPKLPHLLFSKDIDTQWDSKNTA